ncbi:MAG: hypothetical protein GC200_08445 [Tepidisphaera sp.]|nr:hypothetical protein [Tepidisphaera sp.]
MSLDPIGKLLLDPDPPVPGLGGGDEAGQAPAPRRSGSVQLREVGTTAAEDEQAMLDPANQSLAEALKVMMWLLRLAMVVLAGLYLASGFRSIKENERGIRLLFGKIQASNLPPGFAWSLPFPLGELRTVDRAYKAIQIDKDFWVANATPDQSIDKLTPTESLKPGQGGCVLTAEGNIAHTRWRLGYSVEDVAKYSQNVLDEQAEDLVRNAVKAGIVQACAGVTIEQLLAQSSDQINSVRSKARQIAQDTLDSFESGIKLEQLDPVDAIAPVKVRSDFQRVVAASSEARKEVDAAKAQGKQKLLEVAGNAAPYLIREIEHYEAAVKRQEAAEAAKDSAGQAAAEQEAKRLLGRIEAIMSGDVVEMEPGKIEMAGAPEDLQGGKVSKLSGGEVADILAQANSYRAGAVSRAAADLNRFNAKLAQFNANSKLMVTREWVSAMNDFLSRETVQQIRVPNGLELVQIDTGPDPDIQRAIDKAKKKVESDIAERKRLEGLKKEQYNTETELQVHQ